jgi:hypothetical protein
MDRFSKNTQMSNFMKICPVGAELFHADRRADRWTDMKLIVDFRNFSNMSKNAYSSSGQNTSSPSTFTRERREQCENTQRYCTIKLPFITSEWKIVLHILFTYPFIYLFIKANPSMLIFISFEHSIKLFGHRFVYLFVCLFINSWFT